jgi:hypothetical protein
MITLILVKLSPGTIFIEMAAYVGDVLSYYADNNLKESFIQHATERSNVYELARALGYNVKNSVPAYVTFRCFSISTSNRHPERLCSLILHMH